MLEMLGTPFELLHLDQSALSLDSVTADRDEKLPADGKAEGFNVLQDRSFLLMLGIFGRDIV
jgi:hypothetical protein